MSLTEITVHDLLPHQLPLAESPARFKVVRWGRRTGKDAAAENLSLLGHGPDEGGEPRWKGLIHGFDIVWLAPTIPQAAAMWKNEVEPRFRGRPHVKVRSDEKTVTFLNSDGSAYSTLWVRSAEAIDSIRGIGKKLGGVVINEAAWMDLQTAWRDVLRPTLMDCGAWAIIMSTTNAGPDGFVDEGNTKRTPSFFNVLCAEIQKGQRGPEWAEFYGTARDNPKIAPQEFDDLVAEYPPESVTLQQEVFAKLVVGGAGVAFSEWADDVHVTTFQPERAGSDWRWWFCGDWGRRKGVLHLMASGEGEQHVVRHEWVFAQKDAYTAGLEWGQQIMRYPRPEYGVLDAPPQPDVAPDIIERFQAGLTSAVSEKHAIAVVATPRGAGYRYNKKAEMHRVLAYKREPDGTVKAWNQPRFKVHESCGYLRRSLQSLPIDPKDTEDVWTQADDHGYDSVSGGLMSRPPTVEVEPVTPFDENKHPGFTKDGERVRRWEAPDELVASGSRYSRSVHADDNEGEW